MQHLLGRNISNVEPNLQNEEKKLQASMHPSNLYKMDKNINEFNININPKLYNEKRQLHNSTNIAIDYNRQTGLLYIVGRSQYEYSVVYKVLNQIKSKNINFKPQTLFDFGSGIGTVMWYVLDLICIKNI